MSLAAEADFGLSLLRETSFNSTTVLSPLSIALALSLVHAGAKGSSKDQIKNALCKGSSHEDCAKHFSLTQKALVNRDHPYYKNWMYCSKPGNISCVDKDERDWYITYNKTIPADVPLQRTGVLVNIANRIFVGNNVNVKKAYQDEVSTKYEAQLQSLDLKNKAAAAKIVNDFVKNETMGKIDKLVSEDNFKDATKALLVNAVYFHGRWKETFGEYMTKEDKFFVKEGETKQVSYMKHTKEDFPFSQNDDFMVLSLPYKEENVAFTVVLPKKRFGLSAALRSLTGEKLQELLKSQKSVNLNVLMPKFKLDTETALPDILKKLGIVDPFTDKADLSGITGDRLALGDAKHKVTIDVNEKGTTAAASTAIEAVYLSGKMVFADPTEFIADHPFLFVINHGGHILFTGQYYG